MNIFNEPISFKKSLDDHVKIYVENSHDHNKILYVFTWSIHDHIK